MKKFVFAATVPLAGLMMLTCVSAQDAATATDAAATEDLVMGEQTIPAGQVTVVEDWCKELQAQQGLTGTQEPETTMTEEQADAATGQQGESSEETVDLTTITLEMCQEAELTDTEGD